MKKIFSGQTKGSQKTRSICAHCSYYKFLISLENMFFLTWNSSSEIPLWLLFFHPLIRIKMELQPDADEHHVIRLLMIVAPVCNKIFTTLNGMFQTDLR